MRCDRAIGEGPDIKQRHPLLNAFQEDILDIPYLNDPEVLDFLRERYEQGYIYTYSGSVLVVLNPFDQVKPDVHGSKLIREFSDEIIQECINNTNAASIAASTAVLPRSMKHTILISGESGSGKTETCKSLVLAFGSSMEEDCLPEAAKQMHLLLQHRLQLAYGILDSFGNACTLTTSNSSRYGKLIELQFGLRYNLVNCKIQTYLLESSRIFTQQTNERNFNIFYEIIAGACARDMQELKMLPIGNYHFLNQGGLVSAEEANAYKQRFSELKSNLHEIGLGGDAFQDVQRVLVGILALGQLKFFSQADADSSSSQQANEAIWDSASFVLGLSKADLIRILTVKTLVTPLKETFQVQLSPQYSEAARDATVKLIYRLLFDKLVRDINNLLVASDKGAATHALSPRARSNSTDHALRQTVCVMSILDIFGFDSFAHNSLDQLCINFANEALQQLFVANIFKLEIALYEKESIKYDKMEFVDNKENLEFISSGVFKVLDDQCKLPNPTDKRFAAQLYKDYDHHKLFAASGLQQTELRFSVRHYSGPVEYTAHGFVTRNLDHVPQEILSIFSVSTNSLLLELFPKDATSAASQEGGVARRGSVLSAGTTSNSEAGSRAFRIGTSLVTQYKTELTLLLKEMESSTSHFVKCIKPFNVNKNNSSKPERMKGVISKQPNLGSKKKGLYILFDQHKVSEQLKNGGILEALRIARSGYRTRMSYVEFYNRYRLIAGDIDESFSGPQHIPPSTALNAAKTLCNQLIEVLSINTPKKRKKRLGQMYQRLSVKSMKSMHKLDVGERKLSLALSRSTKTHSLANIDVQTYTIEDGIIDEQNVQFGKSRIFLKKREYDFLEAFRNRFLSIKASILQTIFRRHYYSILFKKKKLANLLLQRIFRGCKARRTFVTLQAMRLIAITIQTRFRKRKIRRGIVALQSIIRRYISMRKLLKLRGRRHQILDNYGEFMVARDMRMERRRHLAVTRAILFLESSSASGFAEKLSQLPGIRNGKVTTDLPSDLSMLYVIKMLPSLEHILQMNQQDYGLLVESVHSIVNTRRQQRLQEKKIEDSFENLYDIYHKSLLQVIAVDFSAFIKENIGGEMEKEKDSDKAYDEESALGFGKSDVRKEDIMGISLSLITLIEGIKANVRDSQSMLKHAEQLLDVDCLTRFSFFGRLFGASMWSNMSSMETDVPKVHLNEKHKLFRRIHKLCGKLNAIDGSIQKELPRIYGGIQMLRQLKFEKYRHILWTGQTVVDEVLDKFHSIVMIVAYFQVELRKLTMYYQRFSSNICTHFGERSDFYREHNNETSYLKALMKSLQTLKAKKITLETAVPSLGSGSFDSKLHTNPQLAENPYYPLVLKWPESDSKTNEPHALVDRVQSNAITRGSQNVLADEHEDKQSVQRDRKIKFHMKCIWHAGTLYRFMPYKPAINSSANALFRIIQGKFVGPTKLFKLVPAAYSSVNMLVDSTVYYEASISPQALSLQDVMYSATNVENLDLYSYSAAVLTCCLLNITQLTPHNVLVALDSARPSDAFYTRLPESESVSSSVGGIQEPKVIRLQGFNLDEESTTSMESNRDSTKSRLAADNLNILYLLPHMDECLHPLIEHFLISEELVAEDIMASWIRCVYEQNVSYSLLSQENFTDQDFHALNLPWQLPANFFVDIYKRLKQIISGLKKSHEDRVQTQPSSSTSAPATPQLGKKPKVSLANRALTALTSTQQSVHMHKDLLKMFHGELYGSYEHYRLRSDFTEDLDDIQGVVSYAFVYHQCVLDCIRNTLPETASNKLTGVPAKSRENRPAGLAALLSRNTATERNGGNKNATEFHKPRRIQTGSLMYSKPTLTNASYPRSPSQYYLRRYNSYYRGSVSMSRSIVGQSMYGYNPSIYGSSTYSPSLYGQSTYDR
ncbi:hypothetical protein EON65_23285 [archaeon]|nr:MAG: hypothetical protein EON65_23285 [archaeon]